MFAVKGVMPKERRTPIRRRPWKANVPWLDLTSWSSHGLERIGVRSSLFSRILTVPAAPSISTRPPVFKVPAMPGSETMQGSRNSRETIAEWESRLPRSTNSPAAAGKSTTQPGSVWRAKENVSGVVTPP